MCHDKYLRKYFINISAQVRGHKNMYTGSLDGITLSSRWAGNNTGCCESKTGRPIQAQRPHTPNKEEERVSFPPSFARMAESLIVEDVRKWIGDLQTLQGRVERAQADLLKDVQKEVDEISKEPNLSFVAGWERITKLKTLRQEKIGTEVDERLRCLEASRNQTVSDTGEANGDTRIDVEHNKYVKEATNLFEVETLEHNKKIKVALKNWELKRKEHENRLDRKEVRSGQCKNEVYQLVGYFVVFQGVMFTAVAQSNMLFCKNVWSPVLLSVLASIATIAGVSQKLQSFQSLEVTIASEKQTAQVSSILLNFSVWLL